MAAPDVNTRQENVYFPLKSGAVLVKTKPLFSFDNKHLFACSGSAIKVYSTDTGETIRELNGHKNYVSGLVLHPKNKLQLVSCSLDETVIIWDYADGVLLRTINARGPLHGIYSVEGENQVFLLLQGPQSECSLVRKSLAKDAGEGFTIFQSCSMDPKKCSIGPPQNSFAVTVDESTMRVKASEAARPITHKIDREESFTCVACHPNGHCIATGCGNGKILLWYKFLQSSHGHRAVMSQLHWHSLAVGDLCFTVEGSYLLSGGQESVLVKWHLETNYRDFLPRLGAPINHLTRSRDNNLMATCHDDNVIQVITSNFYTQQVFQGLTRGYHPGRSMGLFPAGLLCDPQSGALVLNGKPGHIQFYSIKEDRQLFNLDVVSQNFVSAESSDKPLAITEVTNVAFDSSGQWMATAEYWRDKDDLLSPQIMLKFWMYNQKSASYVLRTSVEMPHDEAVFDLKMRPLSKTSATDRQHMAVTTSADGKFKLWALEDDTDIYRANTKWICESVGFYRNMPAGRAEFSDDGSLLAVVFGACITLWEPETNQLKETLNNSVFNEDIQHVLFGRHGCSQYLVCSTTKVMSIWSLITCSILWSVDTSVQYITADPLSDIMAVFTISSDLFVFRPSDPRPLFSHVAATDVPVACAVFIPHSKKSIYEKTTLSWQNHSELFFMNFEQELLSVSLKDKKKSSKSIDEKIHFEQNLPVTALRQILTHHRNKSGSRLHMGKVNREPQAKFMTEIFNSAPHVQPSVTTLCLPFIHSLMSPNPANARDTDSADSDDDDDSDDEGKVLHHSQTVSLDSGLDSDMETDANDNQSSVSQNSQQSMMDEDENTVELSNGDSIAQPKQTIASEIESLKRAPETEVNEDDLRIIFETDVSWLSQSAQQSS